MYETYLVNRRVGVKFGQVPVPKNFVSVETRDGKTSVWEHALTDEDKKIIIYTFHSNMKTEDYVTMVKDLPPENLPS